MRSPAVLLMAILVTPVAARVAHACTVPPEGLTVHHAQLVRRAHQIALARFEKATPAPSSYEAHFSTIEVLKGPVPPRFSLVFSGGTPSQPFKDPPGADFHGHMDWEFWDEDMTRVGNGADCGMHPRFESGATYLIFVDTDHWRAFERIDRPDDRWLRAVRNLIATPSLRSGLTMSLPDYLSDQRALFVGETVGCYVDDPDVPFPNEVKVREVLFGEVPDTVRIRSLINGTTRCIPRQRVVGVIHSSSAGESRSARKPAGRLFPVENGIVVFDAEPTQAVITRDGPITLRRLRALAASRAGAPAPPAYTPAEPSAGDGSSRRRPRRSAR